MLSGDGVNEIIMVTREPALEIYHYVAGPDDGVEALNLVARVSLLASGHRIKAGRYPVALSTGYLQAYDHSQPRTQAVVVVTSGR